MALSFAVPGLAEGPVRRLESVPEVHEGLQSLLSMMRMEASRTKVKRGSGEVFKILGEPATTVEPGEGPLDDPAFGQDFEPLPDRSA